MVERAHLVEEDAGLVPASDGWFVVNVAEAAWRTRGPFAASCRFERPDTPFGELGINLRVVQPGQPASFYHAETRQEDFLVLAGQCVLLVEGEERRLRTWDFVHCPPHAAHVFIGAGDGPCVILMTGARTPDKEVSYPVSELAQRYGAGVETETNSPLEAYAAYGEPVPKRPDAWERLPWVY